MKIVKSRGDFRSGKNPKKIGNKKTEREVNKMLINKANLDVAVVASPPSETRVVLTGVLITEQETIATNAHMLLMCEIPQDLKDDDFPLEAGAEPVNGNGKVNAIVPAATLLKVKPMKKTTLPILKNAQVTEGAKNPEGTTSMVEIVTTDLEHFDHLKSRVIDGVYPPYKQVIPEGKPILAVALNAGYVKTMASYFLTHAENATMKLEIFKGAKIRGENTIGMVKVTGITEEKQKITGVIMPIRL